MKIVKIITADGLHEVEPLFWRDGFAVTADGPMLAINHEKSGIAITHVRTSEEATEVINIFSQIEPAPGIKLADIPACELCDLAPLIQAQFAEQWHEGERKEWIMTHSDAAKNGRRVADVLLCNKKGVL